MALWRQLRVPPTAVLLVTIALSLIRARDQPGIDVGIGNTTATIVPGDVALLVLLAVASVTIARTGVERTMRLALAGGAAFVALVVASGATNGAAAFVGAGKLAELSVLALAGAVLVRSDDRLEAVVDVLLAFTIAADVIGVAQFVSGGGGRQSAFLGEHDFAALAALPLLYGLMLAFDGRRPRRAALAIGAGGIGCILGAALASLLGLYLGALALVVVVAVRGRLALRPLALSVAVVAVVTAGTLTIRAGDLGFLQSWFGKPPSRPGQYAASWSQRLIYTYVGERVFLASPVLGTGWYPELPPKEFVRFLPDARRRFADQPARYFPPPDRPLIPQQAFDEVSAEVGLVGSAAFLVLLAATARRAARSPLAAAWLAAAVGAIAGEALFGGTPLTATFFLAVGLCLAIGTWPA